MGGSQIVYALQELTEEMQGDRDEDLETDDTQLVKRHAKRFAIMTAMVSGKKVQRHKKISLKSLFVGWQFTCFSGVIGTLVGGLFSSLHSNELSEIKKAIGDTNMEQTKMITFVKNNAKAINTNRIR